MILFILLSKILDRATAVCGAFQQDRFATKRELNSLSQLAADMVKIFPPDFTSVNPADVAAQVSLQRNLSH